MTTMKSGVKAELHRAQDKIRHLERAIQDLREENEALKAEMYYNSPMYSEGEGSVVIANEEFKMEMRSFWRWLRWRMGK